MQASDPHPHLTLFLTLWAVIAPLVALGVGTFLQSLVQRKQWSRDHRKEECRELLSQLAVTYFAISDWKGGLQIPGKNSLTTYNDAVAELHRVLGSRLLIAEEIEKADIRDRWTTAMTNFVTDGENDHLTATYEAIRQEIVALALIPK
jgi:hypothetical protein